VAGARHLFIAFLKSLLFSNFAKLRSWKFGIIVKSSLSDTAMVWIVPRP
jgi:hypothetical protein